MINPWERAGREFLRGCSNSVWSKPQDCEECVEGYVDYLQKLKAYHVEEYMTRGDTKFYMFLSFVMGFLIAWLFYG